ncbi:MAG TPA: hypothetical protein VFZ53_27410 [Polyangiaceae bacterium]
MSPRVLVVLGLLAGACGESLPSARSPASELAPASGRFTLHADAAALTESLEFRDVGFRGTADVGFEATGCCGLALYAAHTSRTSPEAESESAETLLDGGLELSLAPRIPSIEDRLRMRVRGGKAGTPPSQASAGRSGFAASAGLLVRLVDVHGPAVNRAAPAIDVLVDFYGWSLDREQTSAGTRESSDSAMGGSLVLGLRVGLDYGVELK